MIYHNQKGFMKQDSIFENKIRKNQGFTLVELLITVSIIGIMSVVLSVSFASAQKNGRDQRRIADMKAISDAAEQYYLMRGSYPTSLPTNIAPWRALGGNTAPVILQFFPTDPKNGWTAYSSSLSSAGYCFCALMEKSANGNALAANCNYQNSGNYYCVKNQQ